MKVLFMYSSLRKLLSLKALLRHYADGAGGWIPGMAVAARRVVEIVHFEGIDGLRARFARYFARRLRGRATNDVVALVQKRCVFTGIADTEVPLEHHAACGERMESHARLDKKFDHSKRPTVDIVVCVHNALEDTAACLAALDKWSNYACSLIIVDDGSDDITSNYLANYRSQFPVRIIRNSRARGYTYAANQGMRASSASYVVLLNSDAIVTSDWVRRMIACAESDDRIGIVGPLSNTASWQSIPEIADGDDWAMNRLPKGITIDHFGKVVTQSAIPLYPRMGFLNGFCLLIRREVIERIGYFDELNFGSGYGEENDYCLRARKEGFMLAVADDVYVFHAQSKSYGDERRKDLGIQASANLVRKHGFTFVQEGVDQCRHDRVLAGIRGRSRYLIERSSIVETAISRWHERRVLFVLPASEAGGGSNVVLSEARAMMRFGVRAEVANLSGYRAAFEASYPENDVPVHYISSPQELSALAREYEVVIATANHTVEWLRPLQSESELVLGYYVQDYEPLFYSEEDPKHRAAVQSYNLIPQMRLFTKTRWNQRIVQFNTGRAPVIVGPSVDVDRFRPRTQYVVDANARVRIGAMVRPSSPRRNPEGTVDVLLALQRRFGKAIEIVTFGSEPQGPPLPPNYDQVDFNDVGHLPPYEAARLLDTFDIFIDMSSYQAMGLTAMEAMACGALAVVPRNGGATSFAIDQRNALVVDTSNHDAVVEKVAEVIVDFDKRVALQEAAIRDVNAYYPEKAAFNILTYLMP